MSSECLRNDEKHITEILEEANRRKQDQRNRQDSDHIRPYIRLLGRISHVIEIHWRLEKKHKII